MKNQKKLSASCAVAAVSALFAMSTLAQQVASTLPAATASTAPVEEPPPAAPPNAASGTPQAATTDDADTSNAKSGKNQLTNGIQTVVVTAQKRKEDPNKIAMSISAISGDDLQEQHVTDFTDLTRSIPNISFSGNNGAGPGLENIEMRGVSSSAGASTVGVYMDDTSVTVGNVYSMGTVEPKFFDLDRVEVLRGPQGTLYGSSSMGGTIKFVANQPDLKQYSADTFAEYSNTKGAGSNTSAYVVGNIPLITDELAFRIGVQANRNAGFINQVDANGNVIASGINSMDDQEVRLALKWKPTKNLTLLPTIYYQVVNSNGNSAFDMSTLPAYESSIVVREPSKDKLLVPTLTVNYDMNDTSLTSVSSYFDRSFNRTLDGRNYVTGPIADPANCFILTAPCGGNAPAGLPAAILALPAPTQLNSKVEQFSQEVRLASKAYDQSVSPWTWVGGLYFANQRTSIIENDPVLGINATFAAFGVSPADPTVLYEATPNSNPFPNDNTYYGNEQLREQQTAMFGEANYYFTPTLHATVGLRYLVATDSIQQTNGLYTAGFSTNAYQTISNSTNTTASTPKFALTWEVSPTNTVYASAAKGFRLGGGNEYVPPSFCAADLANLGLTNAPLTYAQDSLWSYEVGSKSRFLDNRLSVNADLFYLNWKDLQQYVSLPDCGYEYNTNVGNATSAGAEIEVKFKPVPQLLLGVASGYTRAVLSDSDGYLKDGIAGAVEGAPIEGVPKFNAQLTAKYNFIVLEDKSAYLLGAMHWVGSSHGALDPTDPDYLRPSYHTLDLSAGMTFDTIDVSVFVKNALDDDTIIQHPSVNETSEGYRVNPRTIGMNMAARF